MYSTQGECICKICDCGRHKCPHKTPSFEKWGKDVCSEYGHQYQGRETCRPATCKPPQIPISSECPLSNITTNRADYVAHDVQPAHKIDHQQYEPPTTPMNDQSVYRNEFTEKPQCASRPIKPIPSAKDSGKFDSQTTNRSHYVPWDVSRPEIKEREKYKPCTEPFNAINTYRNDFVEHNPSRVTSCKPPVTSAQSDAPFNSISEQRHSFVSHNIEPRQKNALPAYVKPDVPFEDITTNRHDFVPIENCKPRSLKPPPHRVESDQPFRADTTNRSDFVAHPSSVPEKRDHEMYSKPLGDMDLKTTYNENFINQPNCKVLPIKPPHTHLSAQPFDGETSYRQNFKRWDQPSNIVQHKEKYTPLDAPFDDKTTTGTAYVAHNVDKQQSCKPPIQSMEHLPFDGQTQYRSDYVNKNLHICPAASLSKHPRSISPEGYCYEGEDEEGHLHFIKPSFGPGPNIPVVY